MNSRIRVIFFLSVSLSAYASAPDPTEIMKKNEEVQKTASFTSRAVLVTAKKGAEEKTKKFDFWRKLTPNQAPDQKNYSGLVRFNSPAEIRNEAILFLEHEGGTNDVLMYLPAYKKIRRIEGSSQNKSFMSSSFSYSDFNTPHAKDYTYKLLREESCPLTPGIKCSVIESTPASSSVLERTGYSKILNWIRQDNFMAEKMEFMGSDEKPFKKMEAFEIAQVDARGNKWLAHRVRMEDLKLNQETTLTLTGVKVNVELADSLFTQQNLSAEN